MNEKNILVVGIFVVDLSFKANKLPSPGETIIGENYIIGPGGKGSNQAVDSDCCLTKYNSHRGRRVDS